jgi:hypothetical protein
VHWPSGAVDRLTNVKSKQAIAIQEGKGQIESPQPPVEDSTPFAQSNLFSNKTSSHQIVENYEL